MEQVEIIKKSLSFENNKYTASYPYNANLMNLPVNKAPYERMVISLEKKLQKHDLIQKFNLQVQDFFSRGVLKWTCEMPQLKDLQQSFIPLTYTLGKNKLRVCVGMLVFLPVTDCQA